VLGVEPGAEPEELKRAFRQQARRWHPDLNDNDPSAEERFKRLNEAYAVLSDPSRRRAWERGADADGSAGDPGDRDPYSTGFPDFEDYLAALFGGRPQAKPEDNGEAGRGSVGRSAAGRSAAGSGAASQNEADDDSGGAAHPLDPQQPDDPAPGRTAPGRGATAAPSPPPVPASSEVETLVELSPEQALRGERLELALLDGTVVEVWTPALAGDGWRLCLHGLAPGGGDHFLQLRVRTAEGLRIDGLRVLYKLELSPAEAALGAQVVVPTLEGPVRLRVPAGSSSGRLLRLRGRGQSLAEQRGDQLVEIRIVIDDGLGDDELALYGRLRQLEGERRQQAAGG
jgi:DnaJ-class molecular chaperone